MNIKKSVPLTAETAPKNTPEWAKKALAKIIAQKVRDYMKIPEHRADFDRWYFQKNGKKHTNKTYNNQ